MGAGGRKRRTTILVTSTNYDHPKRASVASTVSMFLLFIGLSLMTAGIILSTGGIFITTSSIGPVLLGVGLTFLLAATLLCVILVKPSCCFPHRVRQATAAPGVATSQAPAQCAPSSGHFTSQPPPYGQQYPVTMGQAPQGQYPGVPQGQYPSTAGVQGQYPPGGTQGHNPFHAAAQPPPSLYPPTG